ncbi:MAG: hypothetical protein CVU09_12010 [Bacteroidetes bacterium HGW-Bacteroidetes-4]|jgi:hypothetical protein|nr:MAG: hypothetical protein CVU09_12010 [Bacteroidetes bacterium HGW-Bacteroidetes-4]
MKRKQSNQLSSYLAMAIVLTKYEAKLALVPALAAVVSRFMALLEEIKEVQLIQEGKSIGTTLQKQKEEAEMIEITLRVAAAIYVYATNQKNMELQEEVKVSPWYLKRQGDSSLLNRCRRILQIASGLDAEAVAPYGLLPETISGLQKEIDDFAALIAKPRTTIVARSTATHRLKELFKEVGLLLHDEMDKLMLVIKEQEPVFYNEYKAARIIVDLRGAYETDEEENADEE